MGRWISAPNTGNTWSKVKCVSDPPFRTLVWGTVRSSICWFASMILPTTPILHVNLSFYINCILEEGIIRSAQLPVQFCTVTTEPEVLRLCEGRAKHGLKPKPWIHMISTGWSFSLLRQRDEQVPTCSLHTASARQTTKSQFTVQLDELKSNHNFIAYT